MLDALFGVNTGVSENFSPTFIFCVSGVTSKSVTFIGTGFTSIVLVLIIGALFAVSVYTAETVTLPSLTPLTRPSAVTLAIPESDEFHVTFWLVAFSGVNVLTICKVWPI